MDKPKKIPILEIFGPTIQGEGMVAGQKTTFIRTSGCDYRCVWCDSKFTWDGSQKPILMTAEGVVDQVKRVSNNKSSHVTISGGNPAIHYSLKYVIELLHNEGFKVGVETQGTIWQEWFELIDDLTISPKPPSSGMNFDIEKLKRIINRLIISKVDYSIKIVIFDELDFEFAKQVHNGFSSPEHPWFLQVGNSTLDNKGDISASLLEKYEWLCQMVIAENTMNFVRPLPQLHTLIWGNKQGV